MNTNLFVTIVLPTALAFISGGGLVALFQWIANRPENIAKARNLNVTAEINLSDKWREYAEDLEKRLAKVEDKIEERDTRIKHLESEVLKLQVELGKYQTSQDKKDIEMDDLNTKVDEAIESLHASSR